MDNNISEKPPTSNVNALSLSSQICM